MRRGTTPTHTFLIPFGSDEIKTIRIVQAQENRIVVAKDNDEITISDNTATTKLTQEETLKFRSDVPVKIQVRVLMTDGTALASEPEVTSAKVCLENEVLK